MTLSTDQKSDNAFNYGPPTQEGKIAFAAPGTDRSCETAYWLWGDLKTDITPLIILHGGPGAPGRDWKVLAALNEKHGIPVLLYDQIGCGASTHLRDLRGDTTFWTTDLFLAELDNVINHFQIRTYHLLGHSCGTMIAIPYALRRPKGLRKLIISSTSPCEALRVQGQLERRADLPQDLQDILNSSEADGKLDSPEYKAAQDVYMRRFFCRLDLWPAEIEETMAAMNEDDTVPYTLYGPSSVKATGPWTEYDVIKRLPELTEDIVPGGVLLTNGRYDMSSDKCMTPFFTQIRARVKWVRFAESSHMAHVEEPRAFLAAVGDFLTM